MSGIRIYTDGEGTDALVGREVFYSHCAGGPFYCWRFEKESGQWSFSRVHPFISVLKSLRSTNLRDTPVALQTKLDEHYLY